MVDVIDIFSKKRKESTVTTQEFKDLKEKESYSEIESSFHKTAEQNVARLARLRKEREQANKNVMRSYRIK